MRFAEVFLRLGTALVAWMVVTGFFLWLAVAGRVGCDADGDQLYRVLGFVAPVAACISLLLSATKPLGEVHQILRWLGVFPLLIMPFALGTLWSAANLTLVAGKAFCSPADAPLWQTLWPGVQSLSMALCVFSISRLWRRPESAASAAKE